MNKPLSDFNFFDPETIESPFDFYKRLQAEAPVYNLPGTDIYVVTSNDLIIEAVSKPTLFSSRISFLLEGRWSDDPDIKAELAKGWPQVDTLLTNDPPDHIRFSKLVNKAFSAGRVGKMGDYITKITDELIDDFIAKGTCEFVHDFAVKLPVTVIADQLGVPREDLQKFKEWSDAFGVRLSGIATRDEELAATRQVIEFQHYMMAKCTERRLEPRDDILSDLVNAQVAGERPLNEAELLNIIQQLLVAGNETTTFGLTGAMLLLCRNPDQMARVAADPSLIANMVEEVLRLESPVAGLWRIIAEDTELGGMALPKGGKLFVSYQAANRQESRYVDSNTFDIDRHNAKTHLAFGRGVHMCIGAALARKEMNIAYGRLLARLKNVRLAPGRNDFRHLQNIVLRGLLHLNIDFDKA